MQYHQPQLTQTVRSSARLAREGLRNQCRRRGATAVRLRKSFSQRPSALDLQREGSSIAMAPREGA